MEDDGVASVPAGAHLVLFDGVCAFCHAAVRFIVPRDSRHRFVFAPLQGNRAAEVLARHGRNAACLDTLILVLDYDTPRERLLERSAAAFAIAAELDGCWPIVAQLGRLPRRLTDAGYDGIAALRYRLFGRYDACPLPPPAWRSRFLDD